MASTVVGLDIGRTAVRAVELRGKNPTLRRHGSIELGRGAVETGVVADPHQVTAACRELWRAGRFSTREVRLGVSSGSVLVRQIELDWMPPADLKRALRYQVAGLLPVAVDDANLDHVLLGEVTRRDESGQERRMVRILLVATARGAVDEMVRAVRAAGLRARTADLAPLALVRAAAAASRREALAQAAAEGRPGQLPPPR
ncbi:MAG: pilus assembly protein PilM, partial [Nocardioides sp.]|nr:pilus assembly protein PilM [Nocardioides sp.]